MTGTLRERVTSSGKAFHYVYLSYKDPISGKWKQKNCSTGIEVKKGNKRVAEAEKKNLIERFAYLEEPEKSYQADNKDIRICEFIDY